MLASNILLVIVEKYIFIPAMINDYILCVCGWGSPRANKVYELKLSSRMVTLDENCSICCRRISELLGKKKPQYYFNYYVHIGNSDYWKKIIEYNNIPTYINTKISLLKNNEWYYNTLEGRIHFISFIFHILLSLCVQINVTLYKCICVYTNMYNMYRPILERRKYNERVHCTLNSAVHTTYTFGTRWWSS